MKTVFGTIQTAKVIIAYGAAAKFTYAVLDDPAINCIEGTPICYIPVDPKIKVVTI